MSSRSGDAVRAARSRTIASAVLEQRRRADTAPSSSSIRPASTLDRSRISLISASRWRPESRMSRRYSSWRSLRSPNIRSSSTSENPITAFSGVRSSCDMLARNSDLCRLATSSWGSSPRARGRARALWIATADWLASVSSSSPVCVGEGAGTRAPHDQRADDLVLAQRAGRRASTASPRRAAPRCAGSGGSTAMSGTCCGSPLRAARPTNVSARWIRCGAAVSTSSSLVPTRAHVEQPGLASYSKIDPPSVSGEPTAWSRSSSAPRRGRGSS